MAATQQYSYFQPQGTIANSEFDSQPSSAGVPAPPNLGVSTPMTPPPTIAPSPTSPGMSASNTASGAVAGTALLGPGAGTIIGAGVGLAGDIFSGFMNWKGSKEQAKAVEKTNQQQLALYRESVEREGMERRRAERYAREKWSWEKKWAEQGRDDQMNMMNYKKSQAWLDRMNGMMQQDTALKNNMVNIWRRN